MEITKFKTTEAEEAGVWFSIGDARFKVASFNSPAYRRKLDELQEPHAREIRRGTFPQDKMLALMTACMAQHILLGWENLTENGVPVPFSPGKAEELLAAMPKFRAEIVDFASTAKAFEDAQVEETVEALKNG